MRVVFKPGVIAFITHKTKPWRRVIRPLDKNYIDTQLEISIKKFEVYHHGSYPSHDEDWIVRDATIDEIMWLEACEKAGKYVEKPLFNYEIY